MPATSPGQSRTASRPVVARLRFRRALTLMLMTLVLPGSAQIAAGNRRVGRIAMRIWGGLVLTAALLALVSWAFPKVAFFLFAKTVVLSFVRFLLIALAIGFGYLLVDSWRLGDPLELRQKQRLFMTGLTTGVSLTVVGALLFASHVVHVQGNFISAMFANAAVSEAHDGRYNVLLLGGDSGATRWGLRPDSITVASIDAETGRTVLFGLPRNLQNFTFAEGSVMAKQFPNGYNCDGCELNSLFTWALDHKKLFKGEKYPGVAATEQAVEGVTGLKINYFAMVNLSGFRHLVDAVGGVKLHVRDRIPKGALGDFDGKSYIEPGYRTLNGADTLWFARSRMAADDYSRMARQKCVMSAMLQQLSPKVVVLKIGDIAKASKAMVQTDLPQDDLDTFIELALKARSEPIKTVSFVPPLIQTYRPNIDKIQALVQKAIERSTEGKKKPTRKPAGNTTGGSYGDIHNGYTANSTEDLDSAC